MGTDAGNLRWRHWWPVLLVALTAAGIGLFVAASNDAAVAAPGTPVCGTLPPGPTTWNAAGSPYLICPDGVFVPQGATLNLDGTLGKVLVSATGNGGVLVASGTIRTINTSEVSRIFFDGPQAERGAWIGLHLGTDHFSTDTTNADLHYVSIAHAQSAVRVANAQSAVLDHLSITESRGGIFGGPVVSVTNSTVSGVDQDGINLTCAQGVSEPPPPRNPIVVNNNVIDNAGHFGIAVRADFIDMCDPVSVRGNTVTNSGTSSPRYPAIGVSAFVAGLGSGQAIGDNVGGGNGLDAIFLFGRVRTSTTWLEPTNAKAVHPLGYLAGWMSFQDNAVLTVPAGAVVKGGPGPNATLAGIIGSEASIDASAGGAVFTSYSDNSVGLAVCPSILVSDCSPKPGDFAALTAGGNGDSLTLNGAKVRFAGLVGGGGTGATTITNTLIEHSVSGVRVGSTTAFTMTGGSVVDTRETAITSVDAGSVAISGVQVRDSGGLGIDVSQTDNVSITGTTVDSAGGIGIHVQDGTPTVKNNVVVNSGHAGTLPEVAVLLEQVDLTLGPAGSVDGNTGANNAINALALNAMVTNSFTWRTAHFSSSAEPLGYVAKGALRLRGPNTLTVPANSVVKGGQIALEGSTMDATAGGAVFTGLKDDSAGVATCPSVSLGETECDLGPTQGMFGIDITTWPFGGSRGSATIVGAQLRRSSIRIDSGATSAPGHPGFGAVLDRSTLPGGTLTALDTRVLVRDSVIARSPGTGISLAGSGSGVISGSVIADSATAGLDASGRPVEVTGTHILRNGIGDANLGIGAVLGPDSSVSCSSIHDNQTGMRAAGVTISNTDLYANAGAGRFDLDAVTPVDARQNWWGQPSGPQPGQVQHPENADTSDPRSAPSSCIPAPLPIPEEGAWGTFAALTPARILDTRGGAPIGQGQQRAVQVAGVGGVPAIGVSAVVLNVTGTQPTAATFLTVWPSGSPRPTASSLNLVPGQTAPNLVTVKVGPDGKVLIYNNAGSTHVLADVAGWYSDGSPPEHGRYTPVAPKRLLDSRQSGPIGEGSSSSLKVTGVAGVPSTGVAAVVLNVTGTQPTAATHVTVWPSGVPRPTVSNLNLVPGQTRPNLVVARVGGDGRVAIYNNAGATHVIADLQGWYSDGSTDVGGTFTPVRPLRVLDTRSGQPIGPGQKIEVPIPGSGFITADALNVTATEPTAATYLTMWPSDSPQPDASNLNVGPGETAPNQIIAGVGSNGPVYMYNNAGSTHVIVDVAGWFWDPPPPDG